MPAGQKYHKLPPQTTKNQRVNTLNQHENGPLGLETDNISNVNMVKSVQSPPSLSLGIDFSFNSIKSVKKVIWKEEAPWYREISDGFCWLCYCKNQSCHAFNQLVVINRGYCMVAIDKELKKLVCPVCKEGNKAPNPDSEPTLAIRNCGFVNCEWAMKGIPLKNRTSKIYSEGRTYDNKLYTFQENDHRNMWSQLDIVVKKLNEKNNWKNLPSDRHRAD